jgi:hypothetical protein
MLKTYIYIALRSLLGNKLGFYKYNGYRASGAMFPEFRRARMSAALP